MIESKQKILVVLAAVAAVVAILATQMMPPDRSSANANEAKAALAATTADVAKRWPTLAHVSSKTVADKIGQDDLVLIDARSDEEFAVSHLTGAHNVAPAITEAAFMSRFGDDVAGKDVVFYCSVGVRSSKLATRVAKLLKEKGARSVANMAGGIFTWHNEKRPLIDAKGETDLVHSYDKWWGRLVARPERIRNTPSGSAK